MARYAVTIRYEFVTEVEADNEDDAIELAQEAADDDVLSVDDLNETDAVADELETDDEDLDGEDDLEDEDITESGEREILPLDEEAEALIAQIKPD